jgi:hypothetical protein
MVEVRLIIPSKREFEKDVYKPGIISLTRIIWGSIGGGLLLLIIAIFSQFFGIGVLYPPLAATCFINATCVFLRVARPKAVIVGHYISTVGGLTGVFFGSLLFSGSDLLIPMKLGLAVMFAAVFMQVLDADHPPAAATAAIPALFPIIPPPCENILLPLHMAWGGVIAVIFAIIWNGMWFGWPIDDHKPGTHWFNCFRCHRSDILGTGICISGFFLMCIKIWFEVIYLAGLWIMLVGVVILSVNHIIGIKFHLSDETIQKLK